ncbi:GID complex subunit containing RING finger motif [Bonamia ostreae]|uniref:GID complex subunit containing RING finger motif n=1 Tax=Bonamia ostreae TaxID=126728 RepID=A0ABV2AEC9_9EUKA
MDKKECIFIMETLLLSQIYNKMEKAVRNAQKLYMKNCFDFDKQKVAILEDSIKSRSPKEKIVDKIDALIGEATDFKIRLTKFENIRSKMEEKLMRRLKFISRISKNQICSINKKITKIDKNYKKIDLSLNVDILKQENIIESSLWEQRAIETLICDFLARNRYFKLAQKLAKSAEIEVLLDIDEYENLFNVKSSLRKDNAKDALVWIKRNKSKISKLNVLTIIKVGNRDRN